MSHQTFFSLLAMMVETQKKIQNIKFNDDTYAGEEKLCVS